MISVDNRLSAVAQLVRNGSYIADIGTDHAYLPIFLSKKGIICGAVASDINEGPVRRAFANVRNNNLEGSITVIRTDGLCGIENYSPDDIIIAGMGGELISEIISKAPFVKNPGIRLILQPMTKQNVLRKYLYENGFFINDELLAADGEKVYQIISAEYDGIIRGITDAEALVGICNIKNADKCPELFVRHIELILRSVDARLHGLMTAGKSTDEISKVKSQLLSLVSKG